jgi:hypothetical protein
VENGALQHNGGRYAIDYVKIEPVLARLAKQLLEFEARGDRRGAEAWLAKYDRMPADLQTALDSTSDIPVDIEPVFSFKDEVR